MLHWTHFHRQKKFAKFEDIALVISPNKTCFENTIKALLPTVA